MTQLLSKNKDILESYSNSLTRYLDTGGEVCFIVEFGNPSNKPSLKLEFRGNEHTEVIDFTTSLPDDFKWYMVDGFIAGYNLDEVPEDLRFTATLAGYDNWDELLLGQVGLASKMKKIANAAGIQFSWRSDRGLSYQSRYVI